jgi:hypothetical protein
VCVNHCKAYGNDGEDRRAEIPQACIGCVVMHALVFRVCTCWNTSSHVSQHGQGLCYEDYISSVSVYESLLEQAQDAAHAEDS